MNLKSLAQRFTKKDEYQAQNWTGSFAEYLELVRKDPRVTRNAFQRVYVSPKERCSGVEWSGPANWECGSDERQARTGHHGSS